MALHAPSKSSPMTSRNGLGVATKCWNFINHMMRFLVTSFSCRIISRMTVGHTKERRVQSPSCLLRKHSSRSQSPEIIVTRGGGFDAQLGMKVSLRKRRTKSGRGSGVKPSRRTKIQREFRERPKFQPPFHSAFGSLGAFGFEINNERA